jgi:hypothetical protein
MKWVAHVQTRDGELHENVQRAQTHAEKVYGEALSRLAHRAVRIDKYSEMQQFIEDNLPAFLELNALKSDMQLDKTTQTEQE